MAEFSAGFRLFADSSQFQGELAKAARAAETAGRSITRAFEAKNLGRTLATALGLNLQSIAEKLVEPFKDSADAAERIARYTEQAAEATLKLIERRKTDAQILAEMERRFAKMQADTSSPGVGFGEKVGLYLKYGPLIAQAFLKEREQEIAAEAGAKKSADLARLSLEIEEKKAKIRKEAEQEQKKADDEAFKAAVADVQEARKKNELVRDLADFEREQRRAKMTDEQVVLDLRKEERAIAKQIAEFQKFGLDSLSSDATKELLDLKKQQAEVQERIARLTEQTAKAEEKTTKQAEKTLEVITSIMGVRTSRQFGDASDEALRESIRRNEQAIFGMGPIRNIGQDMEVARLQAEIGNLRQELDFRAGLRRDVQMFGVEGARRNFQGDPLAFDRVVQQLVQDGRDQKDILAQTNEFIRQLLENQRNPKTVTPVVVVGGG